jgi:hypothetical protein
LRTGNNIISLDKEVTITDRNEKYRDEEHLKSRAIYFQKQICLSYLLVFISSVLKKTTD